LHSALTRSTARNKVNVFHFSRPTVGFHCLIHFVPFGPFLVQVFGFFFPDKVLGASVTLVLSRPFVSVLDYTLSLLVALRMARDLHRRRRRPNVAR
jgi:hypothetical protein